MPEPGATPVVRATEQSSSVFANAGSPVEDTIGVLPLVILTQLSEFCSHQERDLRPEPVNDNGTLYGIN